MESSILNSLKTIKDCIFFALDNEYRYVSFSNSHSEVMKKIWGVEIVEGVSILDYISSDSDKNQAKSNFEKVLNGETLTIDERYGDNSFFRTMWRDTYSPIYEENKVVGILVFVVELTEHIKMEYRFNELKVFENIVNKVKAGITLIDANFEDRPVVFVNDGFCEITGYKKSEVLGQNLRFLHKNSYYQPNLLKIKKAIEDKVNCSVDLINYKKDGSKFINLVNISPIFDKDGNLVYYVGIHVDVTKEVENGKTETIKYIASGLTHEINTALVTLDGNIDMIYYDIEDIKDEKIRSYINSSVSSIKDSKKIINKIVNSLHYLNISSLEKSKKQLNLYDTLHESIDFFSKKIAKRGIELTLNGKNYKDQSDSITIFAEKNSIEHLWEILIENAIDIVSEKESNKIIEIDVEKIPDAVKISVKDNGKGINKTIRDDIFKLLIKGKKHKGVGIGLFIAKMIVDMHKGNICFSTDKNGTTFDIILNV